MVLSIVTNQACTSSYNNYSPKRTQTNKEHRRHHCAAITATPPMLILGEMSSQSDTKANTHTHTNFYNTQRSNVNTGSG